MGRAGEAMKFNQAFLTMDSDNPNAWKAVCDTYSQLWDKDAAQVCVSDYLEDYPEDLDARQGLTGSRGDYDEAVRIGKQMIEQSPNWAYRKMQVAFWLSYAHRWEEVINIIGQFQPGLFEPEPTIGPWNLWAATHLAQALIETGQIEQAHAIADAGIDYILRQRKLQMGAWNIGVEDAQLFALLGERGKMLKSLEDAIDKDWMYYSMLIVDSPTFKDFRDDPEFQSLVERQAAKMAEQRTWYEKHKDEPIY